MRTAEKWQRSLAAAGAVVGAVLLAAGSAQALTITYLVGTDGELGGGTITAAELGCDASEPFACGEPGTPLFSDQTANYFFSLNSLSGDPDPVITLGFGFTNLAGVPLDFTLSTSLPVAPSLSAPVQVASSMGMTVTEGTPPGTATVSTFGGNPFMVGTIDGVEIGPSSIFPDPASFGCTTGSILPCTDTISGSTGPTLLPATGAAATIGILMRFNASPGDSVGGTATFVVEAPEPGAGLMLLVGLLVVLGRARHQN